MPVISLSGADYLKEEGLSAPKVPALPSIPNPMDLAGKVPSVSPGLNPSLDKINAKSAELKSKIGEVKSDMATNIGTMKSKMESITDELSKGISGAAGGGVKVDKKLPDEMKSLLGLLSSGNLVGAAEKVAEISYSFPTYDVDGAVEDAQEAGSDYDFYGATPNWEVVENQVIENSQPTEAPDMDSMDVDEPPKPPTPVIPKNSIGLGVITPEWVGKLKEAAESEEMSKLIQTTSKLAVEIEASIKKKYFNDVVQKPEKKLENINSIINLMPKKGSPWQSLKGSASPTAAMEKETRTARNLIAKAMARPMPPTGQTEGTRTGGTVQTRAAGGMAKVDGMMGSIVKSGLIGDMIKVAENPELKRQMEAQGKRMEAVFGGALDKDYSEDPNAAAKGIVYEYPDDVGD